MVGIDMATTIEELIDKLKEKDQNSVVGFVVVKKTGELVCAEVADTAKSMAKMLKMFN